MQYTSLQEEMLLLSKFLTLLASFGHTTQLPSKQQNHQCRMKMQMQDRAFGRIDKSGTSSRIWDVVDHLENKGLTTSNTCLQPFNGTYHNDSVISTIPTSSMPHHEERLRIVTKGVASILRHWGDKWAKQPEWQTLLNKKSLLHEVEESIVALSFFSEWLETSYGRGNEHDKNELVLVDVCCGKGILSMLASYLFQGSSRLSSIIMLDRQTDINWNHIAASNKHAKKENRPTIQTWGGCNLNEIDDIINSLEKYNPEGNVQYALIGIHLCKLLSPSCAGLANTLGHDKCPFICLAPCCLPRAVLQSKTRLQSQNSQSTVSVRTYETVEQREARHRANKLRAGAKLRSFREIPCFLCAGMGHPINRCALLPSDVTEQLVVFKKAAAQTPW